MFDSGPVNHSSSKSSAVGALKVIRFLLLFLVNLECSFYDERERLSLSLSLTEMESSLFSVNLIKSSTVFSC